MGKHRTVRCLRVGRRGESGQGRIEAALAATGVQSAAESRLHEEAKPPCGTMVRAGCVAWGRRNRCRVGDKETGNRKATGREMQIEVQEE